MDLNAKVSPLHHMSKYTPGLGKPSGDSRGAGVGYEEHRERVPLLYLINTVVLQHRRMDVVRIRNPLLAGCHRCEHMAFVSG